jgi:hypothetical protein
MIMQVWEMEIVDWQTVRVSVEPRILEKVY